MASNKTTFAVGTVIVGTGLATGAGIHLATIPQEEKTIAEAIAESKFSLIATNNSEDWDAVANLNGAGASKQQLQEFCKENLNKPFDSANLTLYREAVKKCTTYINFKTRAREQLKIKTITDSKFVRLQKVFDMRLENFKSTFNNESNLKTFDELQNKVKSFCESSGNLYWNTTNFETSGNNYLKICSKEMVSRDYGTVSTTITPTIQSSTSNG